MSNILDYLSSVKDKKMFFEKLSGNNGDTLIQLGAKHMLAKVGCDMVDSPEEAELIFINGGGAMNDVWKAGVDKLEYYRKNYPDTPVVVGPSTYRFDGMDFASVCEISNAPLTMFARDKISEKKLLESDLPSHVTVYLSHDLAFELEDSDFITDLQNQVCAEHVLIAMRKDREGSAGVITKTKGTWLPRFIRRPLSKVRDRLAALSSRDAIGDVLKNEGVPAGGKTIFRDVSVSVDFDEFLSSISKSSLVITDRLHVGILAYMLNKKVFLRPGIYHKIKGVCELSMSGEGSKVQVLDS